MRPRSIAVIGISLAVILLVAVFHMQVLTSQPQNQKASEETLKISGSESCINILKLVTGAFEEKYPEIKIEFLPGTDTGDGVIGVAEGILDIGTAARKMKESEKDKYPQLTEVTILEDAMVIGVNKNVDVDDLTSEQVKEIYTGEIRNWNEIEGDDGVIVVLDREETESSKIILREYILGAGATVTSDAILVHSSDSMNQAIENTENSIGQSSLGTINAEGLDIKPVAIDGVMPSVESIMNGSYEMVRDYGIIYRTEDENHAIKTFIDFIYSDQAREILEGYGFVPLER